MGKKTDLLKSTKHRRLEQSIADGRFKLRELFENLPLPSYHISFDGKILNLNSVAIKTLGYKTKKDLIGKSLSKIYAPSSFEKMKGLFVKWKKTGKLINEEMQILTKKGEIVDVLLNVDTIYDKKKKPLYSISTHTVITERQEEREELLRSKEKIDNILSAMEDLVFELDDKGKFVFYHAPAEDKLYILPFEFVGKKYSEVLPPHLNKLIAKAIRENKKKKSDEFDFYLEMKGGIFWFSAKMSPIFIDNKYQGSVVVVRDVTYRVGIEEALKKSEKKYRTIIENTKDIIYFADSKGTLTFISPPSGNFLGYEAEEVIGHNLLEFVYPDDVKKVKKDYRDTIKMGKEFPSIFRFMTKNGEPIYIEEFGKLIKEKGKIVGVTGVIRDITDRRRAEKALMESEHRFRTLVNNIPNAAYTTLGDKYGTCTFMSGKWEEWTGYSPKDFYKHHGTWLKSVHPDDREEALAKFVEAFSKEEPYAFEYRLQHRRTKEVTYILDQGIPRKEKEEGVTVYDGIATDISERMKIEKMKSEFVSITSHQLKAPLTGIKWFLELLLSKRSGNLTPKQKEFAQQAYDSNESLITLVSELLDMSRIESGVGLELYKSKTSIPDIVDSVLKEKIVLINEKNIQIKKCRGAAESSRMYVDASKIKQVFYNLIVNAISFSKINGKVEVGCKKAAKGKVTFYVRDNGVGIPAKYHEKVFEKFFQLHAVVDDSVVKGTGLGLYIVKTIVEAHGGEVWLESKVNKGTTFYFSLPINKK